MIDYKWKYLKDEKPNEKMVGDKIFVLKITDKSQRGQAVSVIPTKNIKYSNEDETWWCEILQFPMKYYDIIEEIDK